METTIIKELEPRPGLSYSQDFSQNEDAKGSGTFTPEQDSHIRMVTNNLQSRWLTYTKPIYPAPTACKRPVRMQRQREIAEDILPNKAKTTSRR